jgi:hypothetical protein
MKPKWNLKDFAWADKVKLPGFEKLLGSWLNVHRFFCEGRQPEFSWEWGNKERSQIGFISNAAVLIGGIALEEYSIQKNSTIKAKYQGRSDLWLRLCPPNSNEDYFIEAKHTYLKIHKSLNDSSKKIGKTIKNARESAEWLRRSEIADSKITALSFFTLNFESNEPELLDSKTNDLISHIKNQLKYEFDLAAIAAIWAGSIDFQLSKKECAEKFPTWKKHQYGVILLASRLMT